MDRSVDRKSTAGPASALQIKDLGRERGTHYPPPTLISRLVGAGSRSPFSLLVRLGRMRAQVRGLGDL